MAVDRPSSPVQVPTGTASSEPWGSAGLLRVASVGALAQAVFWPVQVVVFLSTFEGASSATALAAAATVGYMPLHVRHVRFGLRGRRPPGAAWTLSAMVLVIGVATPFAGPIWPSSYAELGALALLPTDPAAARAEFDGIVAVAQTAVHDTRAVTRDRHARSVAAELDGAAVLLEAVHVEATIDVDLPDLPAPQEDVLAWAIREGVTNVVRHSDASTCAIVGRRARDGVRLEIANDGVHRANGDGRSAGHGLTGLTERVHVVDGDLTVTDRDGWFHLVVELPDPGPGR